MSFDTGNFARAEDLIEGSRKGLRAKVNPIQEALVSLDLIGALLKQGKLDEACQTATSAARFLEPLEGNSVAEAAILALARAGIAGRVTQRLLSDVRHELERARPDAGRAKLG